MFLPIISTSLFLVLFIPRTQGDEVNPESWTQLKGSLQNLSLDSPLIRAKPTP